MLCARAVTGMDSQISGAAQDACAHVEAANRVPPSCQRSWDAERRRRREIAEGRGAGGGWGIPEEPADRESGRARTAPGPPRHNLPKPDKLRSAPWKKESARRFQLGCSSASVGPACASSASGVWVPSVAPVLLQRPAPATERAAGVLRTNGEQEKSRPLFPLILQPSGWSPQSTDVPGPWAHADRSGAGAPFAPGPGWGAAIATAWTPGP
uniref:Uncharacterized protein LOC112826617 n=1 Tax=Callorhinus ursinus TaxID=34884 RepID=A0A3Q7PKQ4_CALUR|nr:uncharacterized protein LOC112826617 [Callorhinus ursinus]